MGTVTLAGKTSFVLIDAVPGIRVIFPYKNLIRCKRQARPHLDSNRQTSYNHFNQG